MSKHSCMSHSPKRYSHAEVFAGWGQIASQNLYLVASFRLKRNNGLDFPKYRKFTWRVIKKWELHKKEFTLRLKWNCFPQQGSQNKEELNYFHLMCGTEEIRSKLHIPQTCLFCSVLTHCVYITKHSTLAASKEQSKPFPNRSAALRTWHRQ